MILRKPYALLIKHFKKIHILLLVLMAYIAYRSGIILKFLNDFINSGTFTRTSFSLSLTYISIYMFFVSIIIIAITVTIYILMRQKKKPKTLYLFMILFYVGIMAYFFFMYNTFDTIEISSLSPRDLRIVRDISTIICYIQYSLLILVGIRAVGFNIKKFNFGEDLAELKIDVTDNEEFELTVGVDNDTIKTKLRKGRREIKYFIIENLFVISIIAGAVILTFGTAIFLNAQIYNKTYAETESFRAGYFINSVNSSYYTMLNQRGESIAPSGKAYIIVNMSFNNKGDNDARLNLDDINIISDNKIIAPMTNLYASFIDLGTGYLDQYIAAGKISKYIFVFEVDKNTNMNKVYLRYRESLRISPNKTDIRYGRTKLKPINANVMTTVNSSQMTKRITFENTALLNTTLRINDMQLNDTFTYEAYYCIYGNCNTYKSFISTEYITTDKTLMKLTFDYSKDSKSKLVNSDTLSNLIKSYGFIRYKIDGKTYNGNLVNKTPTDYNGKDLYYQVPESLKNATGIDLVICIRNKEFTYALK